MKTWSEFVSLRERCWPGYKPKPGAKAYSPGSCVKEASAAAIAAATAIAKKKSGNYDSEGFRKTPYKNPDHPSVKSNAERKKEMNEDLRQWFDPNHPKGGWKRINSKGEAIGPCAREPGEPKPKCMSNEKRAKLDKKERAAAVAAKRRHDPNPERKGKPINVSNFGKGKISEDMENLNEKNVPTSPEKWAQAKAQAKSKFDVYPSAYANGWAAKKYKEMGGGWKSVSEAKDEGEYDQEGDMAMTQLRSIIYHAQELHDMLGKDDNLPEWVQSKITLAQDYMQTACDYLYSQKNVKEETELDEAMSNDDKSSVALRALVAKKNLKKSEGKVKSVEFLTKMKSRAKAGEDLKKEAAEDPYGSAASETLSSKPNAEAMKKMKVTEQHAEKGRFRPTVPYKVPVSHIASPRMGKPDEMKEAKDDTPPFDGPYTKYKGTVTDKSGAKHTSMSRVKDLARQAMKKVKDSSKAPSRLGEEASRKAEIVKSAAKKKKTDSKTDTFQAEPELSSTITKNY